MDYGHGKHHWKVVRETASRLGRLCFSDLVLQLGVRSPQHIAEANFAVERQSHQVLYCVVLEGCAASGRFQYD